MSVEREDVLRIARLARLRLDEEHLDRMTGDLNSILEHVDALASLDDQGTPAASGPTLPSMRAEESTEADPERLDPSGIAPRWRDGFFLVPPPPGVHAEPGDDA